MIRVPTGIRGFDELMEGGFPEGSLILLAGEPGTGKTVFSGKFVCEGLNNKEKCVYVTFMDPADRLLDGFSRFGYDLSTFERKNDLKILDMQLGGQTEMEAVTSEILEAVRSLGAKRLVLDSVTAMISGLDNPGRKREFATVLYRVLQKLRCTTIAIAEVLGDGVSYGMEEFIADGVLILQSEYNSPEMKRTLRIKKLRNTKHSLKIHEYTITDKGFELVK